MSVRPSLRQSGSTRPSRHSLRQSESAPQSTTKMQSFSHKRKEQNKAPEFDLQKDTDRIKDIDLSKYCPKKIFNILFINEADELSNITMKKIIEVSRELEDISYLTFITYDEVVSLVENYEKSVLPPQIKLNLIDFLKTLKCNIEEETTIPLSSLAKLMKIKLIEVMYVHYIKAVTKMQSRKKLIADLKVLTAECLPGKEKTSKKVESNPSSASKKTIDSHTNFDYTVIPIETQDDIIFDDDIHHHMSFYIFHGFYDPDLLKELIVNSGVEIPAILKITTQSTEKHTCKKSIYSDFWEQIYKRFDGPKRCTFLENTFLMNYNATGNDFRVIFEELLYVIRSITEIKLQHLNYIRHMELLRSKENYKYFPLDCFTVYNNFFQKFPMELVNIPILLDTLLKQVSVSIDETCLESASQHSYLDTNTFKQNKCIDPCSIEAFFKKKVKVGSKSSTLWKPITSFLTYENDELFIILNSYKKYGHLVYDLVRKMLKNAQPITKLNHIEANDEEIIHKHDIDPSTKTVIKDKDIVLHFLYLFLFNMFGHRNTLPKLTETDLTKNLDTYNKLDFIKQCQIKLLPTKSNKVEDEDAEDNLYDIAPTQFFWKEDLGTTVLLQQISKAQDEYLYCDQRFSPETDTLLVQFSNCLDEFGVNTKIYDQSLPTLICLRDFCKYTTVEKAEWLEMNKAPKYVRKCVVREECQGAKRITDLKWFPEYSYLIETNILQETEPDHHNENEITFDQVLEEIKHYPPNSKLAKECGKVEEQDKCLIYDFGTKYFQIKGAKTTFHSHDGVKLAIDNTALLDEYSKCSVCLDCRGNSLTLHTGKFYLTEDYNFNMNLADGTIVSFVFYKHRKSTKSKDPVLFEKENFDKFISGPVEYDSTIYESTVRSVDQSYFENNVETNLLNEEYRSSTDIAFKSSESMLERLRNAAFSKIPIYKVNNNLSHVKKLISEFAIPLTSIVKRILHNTIPRTDFEAFTKRYLPIKGHRQHLDPTLLFDARVALPNGLYISLYPSKLKKGQLAVKQEFLCDNASTELEEFRLFTRGGSILIKKIDGSITIFKSNGDVIDHEKLDSVSGNVSKWRTKPCHCKNIEDYRKRVNKLLKTQNEDCSDIAVSRRACFQTKKGYAVNPQATATLLNNKIPYLKNSVLKFDGTHVCLEAGKVRVKKALHVTFEKNFSKNEVYYDRSDGFRCTIDKNGRQLVEFVDGTKIINIMCVANELVDGYVYVSLEFEFQHPNFATVAYRSDGALEIKLNNAVIIREPEDMTLKIDEDITASINKQRVLFEKMCSSCKAKYTCDINIHPLVSGELDCDKFIHATDSYNKHFYADLEGRCIRNQDYIKGPINASNCNHYTKMCYKKLFVVNRNLSGCTFLTDNMIFEKKKAMSNETDSLIKFTDISNAKILVYKFKRNVYDLYANRFLNKSVIDTPKELVYATFCLIKKMIDSKTIENFCQDLTNYFQIVESVDTKHFKVLEKIITENEIYFQKENEILKIAKAKMVVKEECKCVKERISMREKIERWRRECDKYRSLIRSRKLPCYFNSPFCKITTKK